MKLFHAPNSRSVRIVWLLEELGLSYELERFTLGDAAMRTPEYLAINPMGRVPTLEDNNTRLFESGAIVQYLLEKHGNGRLRPDSNTAEFPAYLQWLHYAEGMIMPPVNSIVVETVLLPPERRNDTNVARATKLLSKMLATVEINLEGKDYLAGKFSAADIMTGHATIIAHQFGSDISDKPNITSYINRLKERKAFQKAQAA